jgi:hypothetical protein
MNISAATAARKSRARIQPDAAKVAQLKTPKDEDGECLF